MTSAGPAIESAVECLACFRGAAAPAPGSAFLGAEGCLWAHASHRPQDRLGRGPDFEVYGDVISI